MNARNVVEASRCYWLTGLSGAGKTTLARKFADRLRSKGMGVLVLDGDTLRARLNRDLGFSRDDRAESVRRAAEISRVAIDSGLTVITSLVSPYAKDRKAACESVGEDRFIEVFVDASLDTCVKRDPKGLYGRAQAGLISNFTGLDDPYERPAAPSLHIVTDDHPDVVGVELLLAHFENRLPSIHSADIWPQVFGFPIGPESARDQNENKGLQLNAPDNNPEITRVQDDPALACLVVIARFHGIATDTAQLRHAAARGEQPFDSDALILTARSIGLKARRVPFRVDRLDRSPLPALCIDQEGRHFIVARKDGDAVVAFEAGSTQPILLSKDDTARRSTGYMIVFASRASLTGELAKFDFSWFIPAVVKYRRLLLEVLGISLILQVFGLVTPLMFQVIMDKVLVSRTFNTLAVVGVTLFVCSTFEVILTALRNFIFSHTTNRIDVELGARLFRHLIALPLPYFGSRRVGDTIARVRELENIRNFLTGQALTAVIDLFFSIVFIAVMCFYSIWLTVVVVLSLPLYAGVSAALVPALRQRLNEKFARGADNQSFLVEAVSGVETVKAMSVEPQFTKKWEMQLAAYVASGFRVTQLGNIGQQLIQYIGKLVSLATLILGAKFVIDGKLTIGELIAFNMMSQRVAAPVLRLAQLWQDFQQVGISMSRLGDILNTRTEMRQSTQAMPPLKGDIRFEHVRFRYRPDGKPVLEDVSLDIRAGQVIGIVGRSGSGKSTLTKLLQRLYVPEHGTVRIDGIDLSLADPAWLRRHIGVVLQENYLFNRSVRENIALSDPGAPMAAVIHAAKLAGAHDFICELPQAYDTAVEEHGGNLSGGQRQRIAIARALLTNPRILIFDEATSALDFETERIIQNNMRAISAGRTVIIIAHRLSTVRHADQIFAMDQGRIIERGTHDHLQAAGGYYAHLLSLQHG